MKEALFAALDLRRHFLLDRTSPRFLTPHSGLERTWAAIRNFRIKGRPETLAGALSGGNQQRLLLSLAPKRVRLLLLEEPTRGLDVESAAWTWKYLHHLAASGVAVVFASPDLDEIVTHANRVAVFYSGIPVLEQGSGGLDAETLSNAMVGRSVETATRR
jgi:simple sugar transport system ATP-binding protein